MIIHGNIFYYSKCFCQAIYSAYSYYILSQGCYGYSNLYLPPPPDLRLSPVRVSPEPALDASEVITSPLLSLPRITLSPTPDQPELLLSPDLDHLEPRTSPLFSSTELVLTPINERPRMLNLDYCLEDSDSCPSDSDSCPSDDDDALENDFLPEIGLSPRVSINKRISAPCFLSEPRKSRGRMSVTVRPSLSALEMNKNVIKRKSKSVGDISEISPAFIEHLKTLRTEHGGGLQAFEKFETLSKLAKAEDDDSPGVLKRSTSQTVTEKEIKIMEEADKKNIWEIPSMARKSKIALAILFIGGRLGSAVQNNLSHLSQIASEEKVAGMAQPIIKGQTSGPKKTGVGRSFSFSMKNKGTGLLKDKKYQRPPVAPKPSLRQLTGQ